MKIKNILIVAVLVILIQAFIPQYIIAASPISVGFELKKGADKIIPVNIPKGYEVRGHVDVLQQARVQFDLANAEMTANVCTFGLTGGEDFYFVSGTDRLYNLIITYTIGTSGTVWGTITYSIEPSPLAWGSTSGTVIQPTIQAAAIQPSIQSVPVQLTLQATAIAVTPVAIPTNISSSNIPNSNGADSIPWILIGFIWAAAIVLIIYLIIKPNTESLKFKSSLILGLSTAISLVILFIFFRQQFITTFWWIIGVFVLLLLTLIVFRSNTERISYSDSPASSSNDDEAIDIYCHTKRICPDCQGTGKVDPPPINRVFGIKWRCKNCGGTGRIWD
jgi:hypothetical protein